MRKQKSPPLALWLIVTGGLLVPDFMWGQAIATPSASSFASSPRHEIVTMSPFTVDAARDIGYYAENTLAGSRLNTNLGDLAASITVVTKQQLVDTASVDLNDAFMYEASTEGTNTYTQTEVSRNGVPRDTIAGYSADSGDPFTNATANRVRGLGAADTAQNNYPAIARVPFDAYNTTALEISRGPNSLLFGAGSPAGIVNQSTARAVLNQRATHVESRLGSWDAQRFSFSHNQPLIDGKLAIFVAALHDAKGYERKPSADVTRRQFAALTFAPFPKTRIAASFEHYDNFNNRPNSQTPRDYVTVWRQAGRPGFDPVSRTVTVLDTGVVKGPYGLDARSDFGDGTPIGSRLPVGNAALTTASSALYVPGIAFTGGNRGLFIDRSRILEIIVPTGAAFSGLPAPYAAYNAPAAASRTLAQWRIADRRLTISPGPVAPAGYGNWVAPEVTDRAIYDWRKINLLEMNYGELRQNTANLEFEQEFFLHLHFAAGWFRQNLDAVENYTVSNANTITTLGVDTTLRNMDGTPNPHFGSPTMFDVSPDTFRTPEANDNLRAMLAYDFDLAPRGGVLRWLGSHRILGLWSRQDATRSTFRYRFSFDGGDLRYQVDPSAPGAIIANAAVNGSSSISRGFYLGQNQNGFVEYAPGRIGQPGFGGPSTGTAHSYNWTTGQWDASELHFSQNLFYAGTKIGLEQKILTGLSLALQSRFWHDRILTTFGWRQDDYRSRKTNTAGLTTADLYVQGLAIPTDWTYSRLTDWSKLSGRTQTAGVVVKALRWQGGELALHYNQSDNFNPPTGITVDFFGRPLPKSTGTGRDYGLGVSLFENKLVARLNVFDSSNENAPATSASLPIGRALREDTGNFRSWAEYVVRIRHNEDPTAVTFANSQVSPLTEAMKTEIAALTHVPSYDNWPPSGTAGTQTNRAKGLEFQMIYNPQPNWNIKATAAKVHATYQKIAPELDAWIGTEGTPGTRMQIWTQATAPDMPATVTLANGTPVSLRNFWTGYGFSADALLANATSSQPGSTSPKGFWSTNVQPEIDVVKALQGKTVPNEREWSFNLISNYAFQTGRLKGFAVGGAVRWADRAIAGYRGDPTKRDSSNLIVAADLAQPIFTPSETHLDGWVSYSRKILGDRVRLKVQLNVRDATERGGLLPVAYNLDGSAAAFRIVDPRQFFLTTSFDF